MGMASFVTKNPPAENSGGRSMVEYFETGFGNRDLNNKNLS
jgi:hypothetical protein